MTYDFFIGLNYEYDHVEIQILKEENVQGVNEFVVESNEINR